MKVSGFSFLYPMLMGITIFGGSLEFLAVSLLLSTFAPLQTFLIALVIQARHLFYGLAMLEKYKNTGLKKLYLIFALTDETFSINCSTPVPEGIEKGKFYLAVSLLDQIYWVSGATLGGILGSFIPFNTEDTGFLPNRTFVAWPYTNLSDHRVHFGDNFMTLKSDSTERAFKLGMDLRKGTVAYVNKGNMFVKRFVHYDGSEYPDNGCSFETYTCANFLECETLAEYGSKPDGSMVSHTEYWSLIDKVEVKDPSDEKEVAGIFEKYDLL